MYLVSGLGNPGLRYSGTRHNVGFDVIDHVRSLLHFPATKRFKKGQVSRGTWGDVDVLLHKPETMMNLSGEAIAPAARYFGIPLERTIVVHDELDFDPGIVRIKRGGGAGGHNGLRSIIQHLGSDFLRVRVGVGKPPCGRDGAAHVLSTFRPYERDRVNEAVVLAGQAVEVIVLDGVSRAMSQFNRKTAADG